MSSFLDRWYARVYEPATASLERAWLDDVRRHLLAPLTGTVVEIGAGTGRNLPHYRAAEAVVACEPSPAMRQRLQDRQQHCPAPVRFEPLAAEDLHDLPAQSADAVVSTLVLCSVRDMARTLTGVAHVLRPGGAFVIVEHVAGSGVQGAVQRAANPVWQQVSGGCQLHRDTAALLRDAGFDTSGLGPVGPPGFAVPGPYIGGTLRR